MPPFSHLFKPMTVRRPDGERYLKRYYLIRTRWFEAVLFRSPTVRQFRNEHDFLLDFEAEVPGYLRNEARACRAGLNLGRADPVETSCSTSKRS